MSRGISLREGQLLARSLRVERPTHLVVATVSAGVAANAAVAMELMTSPGNVVILALVFVSLILCTLAVSSDIYSRSSQAVSNLRSIGASRRSLGVAVFMSVIFYAVAGSAAGGMVGVALGLALGGSGGVFSALTSVLAVVAISSAAEAVGVYAGGRGTWPS